MLIWTPNDAEKKGIRDYLMALIGVDERDKNNIKHPPRHGFGWEACTGAAIFLVMDVFEHVYSFVLELLGSMTTRAGSRYVEMAQKVYVRRLIGVGGKHMTVGNLVKSKERTKIFGFVLKILPLKRREEIKERV